MTNRRKILKRFVCIIGVMLVLLGMRLGENGLCGLSIGGDAVFSVYRRGGAVDVMPYRDAPTLDRFGDYLAQRLDIEGEMSAVRDIMRQLGAREVRRENFGELVIIYALAPRLRRRTQERWGEFNVMAAVRGDAVAVGYPVLMGSY